MINIHRFAGQVVYFPTEAAFLNVKSQLIVTTAFFRYIQFFRLVAVTAKNKTVMSAVTIAIVD
jgi:hypothetical protein